MKNFSQLFLSGYLVAAIIHIFSLGAGYEIAGMVTKILLMPLLILYVLTEAEGHRKKVFLLIVALLFSWAGDVALLNSEKEMYFMIGLAAFLCAHIAYIFVFRKLSDNTVKAKPRYVYWIPFFVYAILLLLIVYPSLGDMLLPVLMYAIAISAMGIAAAERKNKTNTYSFILVLTGAVSFILSDSLIALNRFYKPLDFASIEIMLTYIIAQYNIAAGCLHHLRQ